MGKILDDDEVDGIVVYEDRTIGKFKTHPYPLEKLEIEFEEGLPLQRYLEFHAEHNGGLAVTLMLTPKVE